MASELPLALPRIVVLRNMNNSKYLRYTHEAVEQQSLLQFTGEEAVSPYAKFLIERSTTSPEDLVHIRCAYTNKYWRRWNSTQYWIAAAADAPEEDHSNWSCTLFKPLPYQNNGGDTGLLAVRLLHVQLNHYACLFSDPASSYGNFLYAGWPEPQENLMDVCSVVDRESIVVLPEQVAFKDNNGKYLRAVNTFPYILHRFEGTDIGAVDVGYHLFPTPSGASRIKSNVNGKYWRRVYMDYSPWPPHFIYADSIDTSNDNPDTLFKVVKVDDNVIALLSVGNNNFCSTSPDANENRWLKARTPNIVEEAKITVEELVSSREIYDVVFRITDARIYDESIITAAHEETINDSPNPVTNKLTLKHTETKTKTWNNNITLKLGVKTKIKTGIPFLVGGEIEISVEVSGSESWGETKTTTDDLVNEYDALVSPYKKMTVFLLATQGTCDVPFSYSQRDVRIDGSQVTTRMDDGLYTGINSFNYQYQTKEEDIPRATLVD